MRTPSSSGTPARTFTIYRAMRRFAGPALAFRLSFGRVGA